MTAKAQTPHDPAWQERLNEAKRILRINCKIKNGVKVFRIDDDAICFLEIIFDGKSKDEVAKAAVRDGNGEFTHESVVYGWPV